MVESEDVLYYIYVIKNLVQMLQHCDLVIYKWTIKEKNY